MKEVISILSLGLPTSILTTLLCLPSVLLVLPDIRELLTSQLVCNAMSLCDIAKSVCEAKSTQCLPAALICGSEDECGLMHSWSGLTSYS
jgi:hypothetical protein